MTAAASHHAKRPAADHALAAQLLADLRKNISPHNAMLLPLLLPPPPPKRRRAPVIPSADTLGQENPLQPTAAAAAPPAAAPPPLPRRRWSAIAGLPDEVLVRVLRFVGCASSLAIMREVSTSWRDVIDSSPSLWANASLKRTSFARPVVALPNLPMPSSLSKSSSLSSRRGATITTTACCSVASASTTAMASADKSSASSVGEHDDALYGRIGRPRDRYDVTELATVARALPDVVMSTTPGNTDSDESNAAAAATTPPPPPPPVRPRLALGPRLGYSLVCRAAAAGNEWAAFLRDTLFDRHGLRAVTLTADLAAALVGGEVAALRPPASISYVTPLTPARVTTLAYTRNARHPAPPVPGWMAVHAARVRGRSGALVGIVYVRKQRDSDVKWRVTRAVSLDRPISCAGYIGLWTMTDYLTELLIRALHCQ